MNISFLHVQLRTAFFSCFSVLWLALTFLISSGCQPSGNSEKINADTTVTHGGAAPADNTATEADQAGVERPAMPDSLRQLASAGHSTEHNSLFFTESCSIMQKYAPYVLIVCGLVILLTTLLDRNSATGWNRSFNLLIGPAFVILGVITLRRARRR